MIVNVNCCTNKLSWLPEIAAVKISGLYDILHASHITNNSLFKYLRFFLQFWVLPWLHTLNVMNRPRARNTYYTAFIKTTPIGHMCEPYIRYIVRYQFNRLNMRSYTKATKTLSVYVFFYSFFFTYWLGLCTVHLYNTINILFSIFFLPLHFQIGPQNFWTIWVSCYLLFSIEMCAYKPISKYRSLQQNDFWKIYWKNMKFKKIIISECSENVFITSGSVYRYYICFTIFVTRQ